MDGTSMVATLVRAAIVANHAIYNYSEGYTVTTCFKIDFFSVLISVLLFLVQLLFLLSVFISDT